MNYHRLSKFLSLVLRHKPQEASVTLDQNGWCDVDDLIVGMNRKNIYITKKDFEHVVATDEKGRYSFNSDGSKIRANQGHSVKVDADFEAKQPPEVLFHGTVEKFFPLIKEQGLKKMQRHHVHLSTEEDTARKVGERRGTPIVLRINSGEMSRKGFEFFVSANGVWLVDSVPPEYIEWNCVPLEYIVFGE